MEHVSPFDRLNGMVTIKRWKINLWEGVILPLLKSVIEEKRTRFKNRYMLWKRWLVNFNQKTSENQEAKLFGVKMGKLGLQNWEKNIKELQRDSLKPGKVNLNIKQRQGLHWRQMLGARHVIIVRNIINIETVHWNGLRQGGKVTVVMLIKYGGLSECKRTQWYWKWWEDSVGDN